ncbi:MAG: ATP-dependent DNA helicase RecG [Thiotrichales bacterium SG8_50]|nr:MAG: ATP-dependent DNA helicase RecG [Thiotrichales bacterium SG8_50]
MGAESQPITVLKGVGPKLAQKLERLGLLTAQDALFHLPFRYQDRTRVVPLGSLRPGQTAVVVGDVELADVAFRGRRVLICRISDGTGFLSLRFFHFSSAQKENLVRGRTLRCYGEVRAGRDGPEMIHPEYQFIDDVEPEMESALTPVYPTTEGVHQLSTRKLVQQAVDSILPAIKEWLPQSILDELGLPDLRQALLTVHRPSPEEDIALLEAGRHPAQQRLVFEELLAHHLSMQRLRERQRKHDAPVMQGAHSLQDSLMSNMPFSLTGAQQRVLGEIRSDLEAPHPMQRLVQGDVGSGKTIVAALAALQAVEAGYQVAIMAPTELLAEQHLNNFRQWLDPLRIPVARLSGSLKSRERQSVLEAMATGAVKVIVGTHALFQEGVGFARLGLVIVDEQHRFGVHQRLALREKGLHDGRVPHQLIMTATPIPRTLAQSIYADLDVSTIDELPPGRKPVETVVIPDSRRAEVVQRVQAACQGGSQAYWVCPLIEESETLQLQTATDTEAVLRVALPDVTVALVHGRMKPQEKERAMAAFKSGETDLLVATTVIEVGVDVPNASLMIIENSERLGLSQLHQLRGRVGRGADKSSCVLMYQAPLSQFARQRLAAMRETNDGFEIARRDMELRGPGEMLGTRQTGMQQFHIADIVRDRELLPKVREAAKVLLSDYPEHVQPIIERWIGQRQDYADV